MQETDDREHENPPQRRAYQTPLLREAGTVSQLTKGALRATGSDNTVTSV